MKYFCRVISVLLLVLILWGCDIFGLVESEFRLAQDSKLPKFIDKVTDLCLYCYRKILEEEKEKKTPEQPSSRTNNDNIFPNQTLSLEKKEDDISNYFLSILEESLKQTGLDEKFRECDYKLRKFLTISPDLICIVHYKQGNFMLLNPAWEKLLGYSINELLERPFIDFVHPEDRDKTIRVIKENLNNGKSVMQFENRYLTKYGKTIWLEWIAHSSLEDGKIFAIARNISERKHTEALISANERKFRIISEYVSE